MSKLQPKHEVIVHPIAGRFVRQRTRDTYIDATAMCQAAGKDYFDYRRQKSTNTFLAALEAETGIPGSELIQSVRGGFPELQGTWVHPRVAVHLGQWLSVEFQVWVSGIVDDWREMQKLLGHKPINWNKQVPDKFWQEIYRLKGWPWSGMRKNRHSVVGTYFVDLVYDRIKAPGLTEAIELRIPRLSSGDHAVKMHQMLVATFGISALQRHIEILLVLMDKQAAWSAFMFSVNQVLPKVRRNLPRTKHPPSEQLDFGF
ncbi:MAG: KilA-N domain-containing protein [Rhodospirillales bacterium]|nr:KilA-N domain-containing protein [Rhodospirillales bacterium]